LFTGRVKRKHKKQRKMH